MDRPRRVRDSVVVSEHPDVRLISLSPADAERIVALEVKAWFHVMHGLSHDDWAAELDWDTARAFEYVGPPPVGLPAGGPPPLVAIYSAYPMTLTVPGPSRIPMSGLTWVAVDGNHRRKGLLTAMIRDHLHGLRGTDAFVSGLHASEGGIYGRFGYGLASLDVQVGVGRGTGLKVAPELDEAAQRVSTHFVDAWRPEATAALQTAHLAAAGRLVGSVTRSDIELWFRDFPEVRKEKEPRQVMFAQRDGELTGYAVFRRTPKWDDDNNPVGEVSVHELATTDAASYVALVRRLVDLDLTTKVTVSSRSPDDPLIAWAGGPRSVGTTISDALWLRLVEVDRALAARQYAAPCDVVLDVVDDLCDWNAGRWRLTVDDAGSATCRPSDDPAEVRLPVGALGAAYLGGPSIAAQAEVGHVVGLRPGAVTELSRAMRGDVEPVGAIAF